MTRPPVDSWGDEADRYVDRHGRVYTGPGAEMARRAERRLDAPGQHDLDRLAAAIVQADIQGNREAVALLEAQYVRTAQSIPADPADLESEADRFWRERNERGEVRRETRPGLGVSSLPTEQAEFAAYTARMGFTR